MRHHPLSIPLLAATAVCFSMPAASAQVRDGWALVSSYRQAQSTARPGDGGLWMVHPTHPVIAEPVTGLPPDLTGCTWPGAQVAGADFVVRRADDSLVAAGWAVAGAPMLVHVLQLAGSAVSAVQTYDVGMIQTSSYTAIPQVALLPDGRILMAIDRVGGPGQALHGALLGILDPTFPPGAPGALTGIVQSTLPSSQYVNALTVDPPGRNAWYAINPRTQGADSIIYCLPLTPPGSPAIAARVPRSGVGGMAWDPTTGTILVAVNAGVSSGAPNLLRLDPVSGTLTPVPSSVSAAIQAVVVEAVTGDLLVATRPEVWRIPGAGGQATALSGGPPPGYNGCAATSAPGWGTLSGIALNPDPETYGTPTPGHNTYAWQIAPNPGGLPVAGNAFSLAVNADPGPMPPGLWFISPNKAPARIPPLEIDLQGAFSLPIPSSGRIDLGTIPPYLSETTVYFQSFFWEPGLAATRGLEVTIL